MKLCNKFNLYKLNLQKYKIEMYENFGCDFTKFLNEKTNITIDFDYHDFNFLQILVLTSSQKEAKNYLIDNIKIFQNQINYQNKEGKTALILACKKVNPDIEIVELLFKEGADINIKDKYNRTAFMYACIYSNVELVEFLLKNYKNIDIDFQDYKKSSSLMLSCSKLFAYSYDGYKEDIIKKDYYNSEKSYKIMKLLLEKGANVNLQNEKGHNALMIVCNEFYERHYIECAESGEPICDENDFNTNLELKKIKLLLKYDTNVNLKDKNGQTALMLILNNDVRKIISESGEKIYLKNNDYIKPLMLVPYIDENNLKIAKLLLKYNANVDLQDNNVNSVLMKNGNKNSINLLLKNDINVNLQNKDGLML